MSSALSDWKRYFRQYGMAWSAGPIRILQGENCAGLPLAHPLQTASDARASRKSPQEVGDDEGPPRFSADSDWAAAALPHLKWFARTSPSCSRPTASSG